MHTNRTPFRSLLFLVFALIGCVKANSQVVLTIDYTDLSAVKFTATGNFSAINYSGPLHFNDGIALLGFFSSPVNVRDFGSYTSGNLSDSTHSSTPAYFVSLSSWNDSNPNLYTGYNTVGTGNGSDITLWSDVTGNGAGNTSYANTLLNFSNSSAAFTGEAIMDLSAWSAYTNLFPALNATGTVTIWNGNGNLGTWKVVGAAAVPEPATYAALFGLATLGAACWHKRRQKHA